MKTKICNCDKEKELPLSEFYMIAGRYSNRCKDCKRKASRENHHKSGRGKGRFNANGAARIDDDLYKLAMRLM